MNLRLGLFACIMLASKSTLCCAEAEEQCFSHSEVPLVSVIQQAPPPGRATKYNFYPASAFATMQLEKINSAQASMPLYFAQWANHGPRRVEKSNIGPGITLGSQTIELFSSIEKADACTMAQTATILGDDATAAAVSRDQVELRKTVSAGDFTDVCFLQTQTLSSEAAGIWLDYELGDGRTPEHSTAFLLHFADYVHRHGKKVILYTDPLNAPSQVRTGLGETNLGRIVGAFDLTDIMLWGLNREKNIAASFEHQKDLVKPWRPDKMFVVFELNHTTVEDAKTVASLMKANDIRVLSFWRDLAKQGGSCTTPVNRKIACLALGRC